MTQPIPAEGKHAKPIPKPDFPPDAFPIPPSVEEPKSADDGTDPDVER